jgi:hypothetical protein
MDDKRHSEQTNKRSLAQPRRAGPLQQQRASLSDRID